MKCPHCGAEHDPDVGGRFCDACGMSVLGYATPTFGSEEEEGGVGDEKKVRCLTCGVLTLPPTCVACGNRVRTPDDWEEPEE
jgi:rRNA maturation protein Nop10